MYAIFESGGKQYKATAGNIIDIERMDVPVGESLELKSVLMVIDDDQVKVGTPTVEDASVVCHVLDFIPGKKVIVFKSKKRKGYSRKIGHRQKYMRIQVDEIRIGVKPVEDMQETNSEEGGNN